MYNEELENLIEAALEDGVLTAKEKQVLLKKAQSMGIAPDEFEIVLDARLVKIKKENEHKGQYKAIVGHKKTWKLFLYLLPWFILIAIVVLEWVFLFGEYGWEAVWVVLISIVTLALGGWGAFLLMEGIGFIIDEFEDFID